MVRMSVPDSRSAGPWAGRSSVAGVSGKPMPARCERPPIPLLGIIRNAAYRNEMRNGENGAGGAWPQPPRAWPAETACPGCLCPPAHRWRSVEAWASMLKWLLIPLMIEIAPSILAADFSRLADQIRSVQQGGASMVHVDV